MTLLDHGVCGSSTDTPPGTLGDQPQEQQGFDAMEHHASHPIPSLLESPPLVSGPGTSEAVVIKPDPCELAPSPCSDATPREAHPESELFWCPWLYSEVTIPEHPTQTPADTCALPPYPLCPGPLSDALTPPVTRPPLSQDFAQAFPSLALIYNAVTDLGTPNYRGARFPVPHKLNIPAWKERSHLFKDPSLIQMLEFGFPIGYTDPQPPAPYSGNHPSATQHPSDVTAYIKKELEHTAIIGPLQSHPFQWPRSNPMMTRPKKDSSVRRVIVDLSMPPGTSVNSGIPKNSLDGAPFKLRLPNPATLADKILKYGRGCLLYKVDLSRAYRQLRTDPLDWPFLMLEWDQHFFLDISIPFGLRHGASACQRTTEAVSAIAREEAGAATAPYIDDTIGAALPQAAWMHYHHLLDLMAQLGLEAAPEKCEGPTTIITWIGVVFDTLQLTMAIDASKVEEARTFCLELLTTNSIPIKKYQSFLGKLFHATKCTTGARTFFNRLLDALATQHAGIITLGSDAKADITWFTSFLGHFNGVTLIKPSVAQHVIHIDSCLQGGGGICSGLQFYKVTYPSYLQNLVDRSCTRCPVRS